MTNPVPSRRKLPIYRSLYAQVVFAVILGVLLGQFYPHLAIDMKPLGDGFIKLIKMLIAPIISEPPSTPTRAPSPAHNR